MNQIIMRGRLVADPEMNKTGEDVSVCSYVLAVPNRFSKKKEDGNFDADFIRCVCFNKEAEVLEVYATKGTELLVTGRLKSGAYEKDGVKHYTTEVIVSNFEFVTGTKAKESEESEKDTKGSKK